MVCPDPSQPHHHPRWVCAGAGALSGLIRNPHSPPGAHSYPGKTNPEEHEPSSETQNTLKGLFPRKTQLGAPQGLNSAVGSPGPAPLPSTTPVRAPSLLCPGPAAFPGACPGRTRLRSAGPGLSEASREPASFCAASGCQAAAGSTSGTLRSKLLTNVGPAAGRGEGSAAGPSTRRGRDPHPWHGLAAALGLRIAAVARSQAAPFTAVPQFPRGLHSHAGDARLGVRGTRGAPGRGGHLTQRAGSRPGTNPYSPPRGTRLAPAVPAAWSQACPRPAQHPCASTPGTLSHPLPARSCGDTCEISPPSSWRRTQSL